jgi:hypothetical protein
MYMKSPFPLVKQHGKTKKQGSAWPPSAEMDPFGATRRTCRSVQAWDDVEKQAVAWFCSWENIIYKVEKKKRTSVYRNNIYKKNGKTISTKKWNLDVKRTSVYKICMFRVEKNIFEWGLNDHLPSSQLRNVLGKSTICRSSNGSPHGSLMIIL